jgi:hypothetical protein
MPMIVARNLMISEEPIAVGSYNLTGAANLRQIVSSINRSIILIQNGRYEHIAEILKDIGKAIVTSPHANEYACHSA